VKLLLDQQSDGKHHQYFSSATNWQSKQPVEKSNSQWKISFNCISSRRFFLTLNGFFSFYKTEFFHFTLSYLLL